MSVFELENALNSVNPSTENWKIPSDHNMNVQEVDFIVNNGLTFTVKIGTWNLLDDRFMKYTACRTDDGLPYGDVSKEKNLHNCKLADPALKVQRKDAIVKRIVDFFEEPTQASATILCLQECTEEILRLFREYCLTALRQFQLSTQSGVCCITLGFATHELNEEHRRYTIYTLGIDLPTENEKSYREYLVLANVHLPFKTTETLAILKGFETYACILVVGDYNIPIKPISSSAHAEGSTCTLRQAIINVMMGADGHSNHFIDYHIGIAHDKFTNWNLRANTTAPNNCDHMDNIVQFWHNGSTNRVTAMRAVKPPTVDF